MGRLGGMGRLGEMGRLGGEWGDWGEWLDINPTNLQCVFLALQKIQHGRFGDSGTAIF